MVIRDLHSFDIPMLAKLYEQFKGEKSNTEKMEKQLKAILKEKRYLCLVAVENGVLYGAVTGIMCRCLYGECDQFLVVENLIVDKSWRRRKIGSELLKELEKQARKQGCTQMVLVAENGLKDAYAFLKNKGFSSDFIGFKKAI